MRGPEPSSAQSRDAAALEPSPMLPISKLPDGSIRPIAGD
jgi:hypothetical protein